MGKTLMRATTFVCFAFAMTPCFAQESYSAQIGATKAKIERLLKDPASVQYRDVRAFMHAGKVMVCGEVNSKNAYGGYAGFEGFVDWSDKLTLPGGSAAVVTYHERKFVKLLCDGKPVAPSPETPAALQPITPQAT